MLLDWIHITTFSNIWLNFHVLVNKMSKLCTTLWRWNYISAMLSLLNQWGHHFTLKQPKPVMGRYPNFPVVTTTDTGILYDSSASNPLLKIWTAGICALVAGRSSSDIKMSSSSFLWVSLTSLCLCYSFKRDFLVLQHFCEMSNCTEKKCWGSVIKQVTSFSQRVFMAAGAYACACVVKQRVVSMEQEASEQNCENGNQ